MINSDNKIKVITHIFIAKLNLINKLISINIQKIDGSIPKTYNIIITEFLIRHKLNKIRLFKKTSLLASIIIKIVLKIFFLAFNNINI